MECESILNLGNHRFLAFYDITLRCPSPLEQLLLQVEKLLKVCRSVHLFPRPITSEVSPPKCEKGSQTSPIPGRLAYQGPVSERSTSEHSDHGRPDTVLRVYNQSRGVQTQTNSGLFFRGL